ncbi:hypothetical protein LINGRAHAP2_LOCUS3219 [Linum grandiflorum]
MEAAGRLFLYPSHSLFSSCSASPPTTTDTMAVKRRKSRLEEKGSAGQMSAAGEQTADGREIRRV